MPILAVDAPTQAGSPPAAVASPAGLSWRGLTLYGAVDVGLAWLSHGAPLSGDFGPGLPFVIQKFSDRAILSIAPNGLAQSRLGLAGDEPLGGGVRLVFRLETGFDPTSGALTDGPASLVRADGQPLDRQTTNGDQSRAGQPLQGAAYAGLSLKRFGTVTFGRQNSLILDDLGVYDPQAQSQAFSPIGYSGVAGGGGDTEDARLNLALKYAVRLGAVRLAYLHQFEAGATDPGGADQADVGLDRGRLSVDVAYSHVRDAVAASALTAAQNALHPGTLAATVSDNTAWIIQTRYVAGPVTLFAATERLEYANPSRPLAAPFPGLGGYDFSSVNDAAYGVRRRLEISWAGARWAATRRLTVSAAYYRYDQNSYHGDGCADTRSPSCAGALDALSVVADQRLSSGFDVYSGLTWSRVSGGLASGYLHGGTVGEMTGARFSF